jgi:hypothetical protein
MMEAVRSSEILVTIYQTTRLHNPEKKYIALASKLVLSLVQRTWAVLKDSCVYPTITANENTRLLSCVNLSSEKLRVVTMERRQERGSNVLYWWKTFPPLKYVIKLKITMSIIKSIGMNFQGHQNAKNG